MNINEQNFSALCARGLFHHSCAPPPSNFLDPPHNGQAKLGSRQEQASTSLSASTGADLESLKGGCTTVVKQSARAQRAKILLINIHLFMKYVIQIINMPLPTVSSNNNYCSKFKYLPVPPC